MTPDTSAQDAPVASQEADEAVRDARDAVWGAAEDMPNPTDRAYRDWCHGLTAALDAYEAAIRASERAKVEALVDAATEIANLPMLRGESGVGATYTVTYKDTGAMDRLEAALRALAGQSEEGTG